MKRYFSLLLCLALCLGCLALAACGAPAQPPAESTTETPAATQAPEPTTQVGTERTTPHPHETEPEYPNEDFELGPYRPIYYDLSVSYVNLVDRDEFLKWRLDRVENNYEEYLNECIAVSFIKKFNISKDDFSKANEERRRFLEERGDSPEDQSLYELYPVDLIYTFDNKKINEFFLWENSIYANEV
jgi:hypothetical protein